VAGVVSGIGLGVVFGWLSEARAATDNQSMIAARISRSQ